MSRRPPSRIAALVVLLGVLGLTACGEPPAATVTSPAPPPPAGVTLPPANAAFDYQIGGAYPPAAQIGIVERDHHEDPAAGVYGICYLNAFQTQPEDEQWWTTQHPGLLLLHAGQRVEDPDWPGEFLLDTSTATKRSAIATIVGSWVDGCADRGYRAVEPDNLDSWTRSGGALTVDDNLDLAALLADHAHGRGLAVAQKNAGELGALGRDRGHLDFAVAEECQVFDECGDYTAPYGDHVLEIEYTDNGRDAYAAACADQGRRISVTLRDRDVVPRGDPAHVSQQC